MDELTEEDLRVLAVVHHAWFNGAPVSLEDIRYFLKLTHNAEEIMHDVDAILTMGAIRHHFTQVLAMRTYEGEE